MEDEYALKKRQRRGSGIRPFLPVIGLFLIVSFGLISYFVGQPVTEFASGRMGFQYSDEMVWVFRVVIFFIMLAIAAAILAAAAPKTKVDKLATEKQMALEKKQKEHERLARKKELRQVQKKMFEENRRKTGQK